MDYDRLRQEFTVETARLLETAEAAVLDLEKSSSPELIDAVFRSIHTIKGNAGIFDEKALVEFAHALESYLSGLRSGQFTIQEDTVDLVLSAIDRIRQMVSGQRTDIDLPLLARLNSAVNRAAPALAAATATAALAPAAPASSVSAASPASETTSSSAQSPPVSGPQSALKIPAKFMRDAVSSGKYLAVATLDAAGQAFDSLDQFARALTDLQNAGVLLQSGVRQDGGPDAVNGHKRLPYYMILTSEESPAAMMERYSLTAEKLRILTAPEAQARPAPAAPSVEPAPVTAAPSPAPQPGPSSEPAHVTDTHLRVPIVLIDSLMNLAGEAVIARNELLQKTQELQDQRFFAATRKLGHLITNLQEQIMRTRLQELNAVFQRVPRIVRDASHTTGKQVRLVMDGGEVELDKSLIESIAESMLHLVRNAVDHGIEPPAERVRLGKPEAGTLRIHAVLRGGHVVLSIQDDGRGLNFTKIRHRAVQRGLVTAEKAEALTHDELAEMIFLPGFSTAETVTATSGRGVGMDIVRNHFKRAGGSVDIASTEGHGTTFTAMIPQTLSITNCLLVLCGGERFAIPQQNIVELNLVEEDTLREVEGHNLYQLRGRLIPIVPMGRLLYPDREQKKTQYVAVVRTEKHLFGLLVDDILSPEEIVIRPLGAHYADIEIFSGAAIMGDGEAVMILDVAGIARKTGVEAAGAEDDSRKAAAKKEGQLYLTFSASGRKFALPVANTPRIVYVPTTEIERIMGRELIQVKGEAITLIRTEHLVQVPILEASHLYLIVVTLQGHSAAIACHDVMNVEAGLGELDTSSASEGILGHTVHEGVTTVVLDPTGVIEQARKHVQEVA
jgi:two-component system chemotaxis sensor kinase CheA